MKFDGIIKALPNTPTERLYEQMAECRRRLGKNHDANVSALFEAVRSELVDRFRSVGRRPMIDYFALGLNVGDNLIVEGCPDEVVAVLTNRTLKWRGSEIHLTPLKEKLREIYARPFRSGTFKVGSKSLYELYCDAYGVDPGEAEADVSESQQAVV